MLAKELTGFDMFVVAAVLLLVVAVIISTLIKEVKAAMAERRNRHAAPEPVDPEFELALIDEEAMEQMFRWAHLRRPK